MTDDIEIIDPTNIFGLDPEEAVRLVDSLSPREKQVAERIVMGMSSKEIMSDLGLSKQNLAQYRVKIMLKLRTTVHGFGRILFCAAFGADANMFDFVSAKEESVS